MGKDKVIQTIDEDQIMDILAGVVSSPKPLPQRINGNNNALCIYSPVDSQCFERHQDSDECIGRSGLSPYNCKYFINQG